MGEGTDEMMTKEEILQAVQKIRDIAGDDERAHSQEDALREGFIEFIVERNGELGELARLVLSTNEIDFARWCA